MRPPKILNLNVVSHGKKCSSHLLYSDWKLFSLFSQVRNNSNMTCIVKIGRDKYCRMYLTTIVNPDGSSYAIRYHEPRKIIKLPLDTSTLTPEELEIHLNRRKVEKKIIYEEQIDDDFDVNRYSHLWKSKDK